MSLPISASLQMSSSAEAKGAYTGSQDQEAIGGSGNRGFVNNFAAPGANIKAGEVNGPAFNPSSLTWMLPLLAVAAVAFWLWKRRH